MEQYAHLLVLGQTSEIPAAMAGLTHCTVVMSGEWTVATVPIQLITPGEQILERNYSCTARCSLRPR